MTNPRIKDVAALAGVSTATVSHVINKTRFVTEATALAVLEAIQRIGYIPNIHARNLAAGSSKTLGLIISDITNPFFPDLVKSIQLRALETGYEVIVANTGYGSEHDVPCVQRLLELRVAGMMIMTTEQDDAAMKQLIQSKVPTVFLDIGEASLQVSNIRVNYETGIQQAVEYLLELGHQRIAFISGPDEFMSAHLRRDAFVEATKNHYAAMQMEPLICEGTFEMESGRQAVRRFLEMPLPPTAIIAVNDLVAAGAMGELKQAGLRVPGDVSVIGFDDVLIAQLTDPPLTSIMIPRAEIGRAAVDTVLNTNASEGRPGIEIRIQTKVVVRGSSGPAPQ